MPFYDYRCEKGHEYEVIEKMDEPHDACPDCGRPTERLLSASNVRVPGGTPIHHKRAPRK